MSTLSNKIFHDAKHYLSSPYGRRGVINTSAGSTSPFHSGCDYATFGIKLKQYAVAKGTVLSCGVDTAYGGAKYVWVSYPSLGVKMLHYHLDSISVKAGQSVTTKTVLGTTGQTGKATGIHLHLGIKKLSGGDYIDPEQWSKDQYDTKKSTKKNTYSTGDYKVTADVLNVRTGAGTSYSLKKFSQFTTDAQTKIKKLAGSAVNGYVKGLTFTALEVKDNWGKTPSGWVCLDYCTKL